MNNINIVENETLSYREKEVYRILRTNIEFTGVENKVITITSCTPNDGKTTVAFNLASSFAESGKNVLLIDADLRKSVLARRYGIENNPAGLSHLLSGKQDLDNTVYSTNKNKFYLLPSGYFPSNPTELLGNKRFSSAVAKLKETFDYVIIDTPPLGTVIDAAVVSRVSDASMLVVASNVSSRGEVASVISQLKSANPNFLGVVLNKFDHSVPGCYGKKYGGYYYYKKYGNYYLED